MFMALIPTHSNDPLSSHLVPLMPRAHGPHGPLPKHARDQCQRLLHGFNQRGYACAVANVCPPREEGATLARAAPALQRNVLTGRWWMMVG